MKGEPHDVLTRRAPARVPKRRLLGYDRAAVDAMLDDVADSYEQVWRERVDLGDHIERLETELARHKELEHLLRATLLSAEQAANVVKEKGRMEADGIIEEARHERARSPAGLAPTASRCCSMHVASGFCSTRPSTPCTRCPRTRSVRTRLRSRWVRRLRRGRKSADGRYLYWLGMGNAGTPQAAGIPGAGRSEIVGRYGDAWKVRIGAAPERGRANAELLDLLSERLCVRRAELSIVSGLAARDKVVELRGLSARGGARLEG